MRHRHFEISSKISCSIHACICVSGMHACCTHRYNQEDALAVYEVEMTTGIMPPTSGPVLHTCLPCISYLTKSLTGHYSRERKRIIIEHLSGIMTQVLMNNSLAYPVVTLK